MRVDEIERFRLLVDPQEMAVVDSCCRCGGEIYGGVDSFHDDEVICQDCRRKDAMDKLRRMIL